MGAGGPSRGQDRPEGILTQSRNRRKTDSSGRLPSGYFGLRTRMGVLLNVIYYRTGGREKMAETPENTGIDRIIARINVYEEGILSPGCYGAHL